MTRLLHAAARGARIEKTMHYDGWNRTFEAPLFDTDTAAHSWRVHPDDEHLAYGPISTALREYAETGKTPFTLSGLMAQEAVAYEAPYPSLLVSGELHRSLFLLILAEALADEGL